MSDQPNHNVDPQNNERGKDPQRPLSEISHLFLSSVRDRQTNGAARPVRKPPGSTDAASKPPAPDHSIDLTPEEFAEVYGGAQPADHREGRPQVAAVIAAHLNGRQIDRVREYASHLASTHGRIGLIEVDASEFRLMLFERQAGVGLPEIDEAVFNAPEKFDPKRMTEALEELNWDVDRWLLLLPTPRTPEARDLLRAVDHWTLLATCDHDGMVSAYRTLKGLADIRGVESANTAGTKPKLSLALLDVRSNDEADRVALKLATVCQQFLDWEIESEPIVKPAEHVVSHQVLCCRAGKDTTGKETTGKEASGNLGQQFAVVHAFLSRSDVSMQTETPEPMSAMPLPVSPAMPLMPAMPVQQPAVQPSAQQPVQPVMPASAAPVAESTAAFPAIPELRIAGAEPAADVSDVIDLAGDEATPAAVVAAVLRGSNGLAETSLKAPTCPGASLAVSRDRKLVLVAVARQGLCDLRDIAQAYRWMSDNRPLIAMALPQFAIEPAHAPRLQLLIDQSDLSAEMLQPLLQSAHVTVQTYRKLRWGTKTGLLLEAA